MTRASGSLLRSRRDLADLVMVAADTLDLPEEFVLKDFWAMEVLRAATTSANEQGARAVFKGGTSLSRAWGVINRFSEDIDLLLEFPPDTSKGAKERALKRITQAVEDHLGVTAIVDTRTSKKGVKRNSRFVYEGATKGVTSEGVFLEMGVRGGPNPTHQKQVSSTVTEYIQAHQPGAQAEWQELSGFETWVLAPHRTLLEKLSLLHHLGSTYPDSAGALALAGRHYYDVHCCLNHTDVLDELAKADVAALSQDIEDQSLRAGWPFTARPEGGYATSPAFARNSAYHDAAHQAYTSSTRLFYGDFPEFDECLSVVHREHRLL